MQALVSGPNIDPKQGAVRRRLGIKWPPVSLHGQVRFLFPQSVSNF